MRPLSILLSGFSFCYLCAEKAWLPLWGKKESFAVAIMSFVARTVRQRGALSEEGKKNKPNEGLKLSSGAASSSSSLLFATVIPIFSFPPFSLCSAPFFLFPSTVLSPSYPVEAIPRDVPVKTHAADSAPPLSCAWLRHSHHRLSFQQLSSLLKKHPKLWTKCEKIKKSNFWSF